MKMLLKAMTHKSVSKKSDGFNIDVNNHLIGEVGRTKP